MSLRLQIIKFLFLLCTIQCSASDLLKVDNIYVSEKSGDQIDSKSIAIINGIKVALKKLISTLHASQDKQIDNIDCINEITQPEKLLNDYIVKDERVTAQSYSAHIDFIFNKQKVESLINKCGFDYTAISPGKVLLVPLIMSNNNYRIVDRELDKDLTVVFNNLPTEIGLLKIETIYNSNVETIQNLDLNILLNGSYNEILNILKKYNRVTLLLIRLKEISEDKLRLHLRFISDSEEYKDTREYIRDVNENKSLFLMRVYNTILKEMDLNWKKGFTMSSEQIYNSGVKVELADPSQWKKLNNILRQIDSIKQYKFKTIDSNEVEIDMRYVVSPEKLSQILRQHNIAVFKKGDETVMKFIK